MKDLVDLANFKHIGKPIPVPSQLFPSWSDTNSSNIQCSLSAGMPFPLSTISTLNYSWHGSGVAPL